jgi:hypothetical protein
MRLTESNSMGFASGGNGISNRLAAATWYLNEAIVMAAGGWSGINIHAAYHFVSAIYNPIVQLGDGNFGAGPIFYGLFLFSKIEGQQILPLAIGGNGNIQAIATKGANGNANILAVNNDVSSSVIVTPQQSGAWTTANVLVLQDGDGNGCASASPVVGGAAIGESGSWSGTPFSIANGGYVSIPPCGAALIQIQP